jgi:hypothetical protein
MTQVSPSRSGSVIPLAVGDHKDEFAYGFSQQKITEWLAFQNQDGFTRTGDLVLIANLG